LFSATSVAAMLASGWLIDRIGSGRLAMVYLVPIALGYLVLAAAGSIPGAALGMVLSGVSVGMAATISAAFWAEYFGTRYLGEIRAMTAAIMVLGTALGPGITGVLIDLGWPLASQFYGISGYFLLSASLAALGVRRARPLLSSPAPQVDVIRS
jgi:MFS family permease